MVDRDLAKMYGVETRMLNQAVKRNGDRFPEDFMFSLDREEILNLSQSVISSKIKHAPNVSVFTEQGVAMLSSVLRSKRAVQVNIAIMRAFVRVRQVLATHKELAKKLEELELKVDANYQKHDKKIQIIFETIKRMLEIPKESKKNSIGFRL